MCVHIQCIDTKIVRGEVDGLEDFSQSEVLTITEENDFVWRLLHL